MSNGNGNGNIVDKIRKLMRLAESPNENEATLSAERAAELMAKYEIEQADLRGESGEAEEPVEKEAIEESGRMPAWRVTLAGGVARSLGCSIYISGGLRGTRVIVLGQRSKIQTATYMQGFLSDQINRFANEEWRSVEFTYASARRWKNSFRCGCASRVARRLTQKRETIRAESNSMALMVLNKNEMAVKKAGAQLNLRGSYRTGGGTSCSGYAAGQAAGNRVNLGGASGAIGAGQARLR